MSDLRPSLDFGVFDLLRFDLSSPPGGVAGRGRLSML